MSLNIPNHLYKREEELLEIICKKINGHIRKRDNTWLKYYIPRNYRLAERWLEENNLKVLSYFHKEDGLEILTYSKNNAIAYVFLLGSNDFADYYSNFDLREPSIGLKSYVNHKQEISSILNLLKTSFEKVILVGYSRGTSFLQYILLDNIHSIDKIYSFNSVPIKLNIDLEQNVYKQAIKENPDKKINYYFHLKDLVPLLGFLRYNFEGFYLPGNLNVYDFNKSYKQKGNIWELLFESHTQLLTNKDICTLSSFSQENLLYKLIK